MKMKSQEKCEVCGYCTSDNTSFTDKSLEDFYTLVQECELRYTPVVQNTESISDKESILRWLLLNATEIEINASDINKIVSECMILNDRQLNLKLRDYRVYLRPQDNFIERKESALMYAAKKGDPEIISWLYEFYMDEEILKNAMFRAAKHGKLKNIIRIFNLGAFDTSPGSHAFETICVTAAQNGFFDIIKWLYNVYLKNSSETCYSILCISLEKEFYHIAKWILDQEGNITENVNSNVCCANIAADSGKIEVLKWLHENNYDLNGDGYMYRGSTLHIAAEKGHLDLVKWLIKQGFNVRERNSGGYLPLHLALQSGHLKCVNYLMHIDKQSMREKNENGDSALHFAAMSGNIECVKFVLNHGADITALNSFKSSPLHAASKHLNIIKYLVEQGCDIHVKNDEKKTVLSLAALHDISIVKWLLSETDADVNDVVNVTSAWSYCTDDDSNDNNDWKMLKLLLSYLPKWNINVLHNDETMLMQCVTKFEAVKLLVEHGADVNVISDSNTTVLLKALSLGEWDVAIYLIQHGAIVNFIDNEGNTYLHHALRIAQPDSVDLIKHLIDTGVDIKAQNNEGESVLHIAVENDSINCIKFLIANGADVNAVNNENISVIQNAAHHNEWNNVKYLITEENVVLNMETYNFFMFHAIYFQRLDIADWIVEICPSPDLLNVNILGLSSVLSNCPYISDINMQLDLIKLCIKYGADINGVDWENETILYKLVTEFKVVQLLLQNGAQVNVKSPEGRTPLHKIVTVDFNIYVSKELKIYGKDKENLNSMLQCYASDLEKNKIISLLVKFGANVNAKDNSGLSVLHLAAANKNSQDAARLLVQHGADVNAQDNQGNTILHTMYYSDLTSYLIEHNASVKIKNRKGQTVLHRAAASSDFITDEKLICTMQWLQNRSTQYKETLIQEKILSSTSVSQYLRCLTHLIDCSDIHDRDNAGLTALHHAVMSGNIVAFKCLLKHGARVDDITNTGHNVLHIAALHGHEEILNYILSLNVKSLMQQKTNDMDTVIHLSMRSENLKVIKSVLEHCVEETNNVSNVNYVNKDQLTALHLAVASNLATPVNQLLDKNADIFVRNLDDMTPIAIAVKHFHITIFKSLVKHLSLKYHDNYKQLLYNFKNKNNESLLHIAVKNSNYDMECIDIIKYLLKEKLANVNAQDKCGKTALHYVCKEYMFKTIALLVDNGGDINIKDKKGNTAFHIAVQVGSLEITEFLLQHGGNINLKNERGNTCIQIAASHGKIKLIEYFIKNGANLSSLGKNKKGLALIHNISNSGGLKLLNYLIENYPEINIHELSNKKQTALALVLKYKFYNSIISKLLEFGVTNKQDIFSNTEMHIACRYLSQSNIEKMLSKNANINIQNKLGDTAMHIAIQYTRLECTKIMLPKFNNLNLYNNKGYNLLHVSLSTNNIEIIEHWIRVLGVHSVTSEGNNVIGVALSENNTQVLHYLVDNYSELLSSKNYKGETILQYYLSLPNQTINVLEYLIQHGANIHEKSREGDSCLHVATNFAKVVAVKYFLDHGIDVNVKNDKGLTPLHIAAENGYTDFVKLLHKYGGDVNCRDNEGRSVLHVASINNNASVVKYLEDLVSE